MAMTIAQGSVYLTELLEVLEDLYWEAQSVTVKNQCFNAVRLLQIELTELTKISVQDHHYDYEVISCPPSTMQDTLQRLWSFYQQEALRNKTEALLKPLLEQAKEVFK